YHGIQPRRRQADSDCDSSRRSERKALSELRRARSRGDRERAGAGARGVLSRRWWSVVLRPRDYRRHKRRAGRSAESVLALADLLTGWAALVSASVASVR